MSNRIQFYSIVLVLIITSLIDVVVSGYYVQLEQNGPAVKGGHITFRATLYKNNGQLAKGTWSYFWTDNAIPAHTRYNKSESPVDQWSVHYNASVYPRGDYTMQVTVDGYFIDIVPYEVASARITFQLTETLNGEMVFVQNNKTRNNIYVSNMEPVIQKIHLKDSDRDFIKNATSIKTFWFIDCTYYGFTNDTTYLPFNYSKPDQHHIVEALIVADFNPLPPPITTTTTTTTTTPTTPTTPTTTTTIKPNTTTTKPNTTTTKPNNTTTTTKPKTEKRVAKRDVTNTTRITINQNGTLVPYTLQNFPFICNGSQIVTSSNKTYGYFSKSLIVKMPIRKVNVTGNNWLQHSELLSLSVKCEGSQKLESCIQYKFGQYNVTGNETCDPYIPLEDCDFKIQRYFSDPSEHHTVLIIIKNEVSKTITPITVTVYKVKKQAQLSVIVVPVVSCMVAVILIVFGIGYYIQNRSRFIIEVADFNFGQNYSDMEYKTFQERLRDSITNAFFTRAPTPGSSEVPVWPPGRKYGSMTS